MFEFTLVLELSLDKFSPLNEVVFDETIEVRSIG